METFPEKKLPHRLFEIGVILKGIHGIVDLFGALGIFLISGSTIYSVVASIFSDELSDDPNDFLANFFLMHASHITKHGKNFAALYLFVSGIINLILAVGLLLHRKGMFPTAKAFLGLFVLYQIYLFTRTGSWYLLALAAYDCLVLILIYFEYRRRWPKDESPAPAT